MNEHFVIVNVAKEEEGRFFDRGLFWNNIMGWIHFDGADKYTALEKETFENRLPMDGKWIDFDIASAIVARMKIEDELNHPMDNDGG